MSASKKKKGGGSTKKDDDGRKMIARNRRARFEYLILDTFEAGLVLTGTEVKSLRTGEASIQDAYARIDRGEVWLLKMFIPEYSERGYANHEPRRKRKLLLHKREIRKLVGKLADGQRELEHVFKGRGFGIQIQHAPVGVLQVGEGHR